VSLRVNSLFIGREDMQVCVPAWGSSPKWRKVILYCAVLSSVFAIQTRSQVAAESAHQEKARKAIEKSARHVYTDDDLKRKTILTPEDQVRVEARKQRQNASPVEQNAKLTPNASDPNVQAESLGEIARRLRQKKATQESEQATKKKFSPFRYEVPADALAQPVPEVTVAPLIAPASGVMTDALPTASARRDTGHSMLPAARGRISPFQPRPLSSVAFAPPLPFRVSSVLPARVPEASRRIDAASRGMKGIEVQPGQSWWKLAELYLGSGARWQELWKLNAKGGHPSELLKRGSIVLVPQTVEESEARSLTIEVRKGDTLWSLAQERLGRGSAWECLASANPQIVDYRNLAVGMRVRLLEADALRSCLNQERSKAIKSGQTLVGSANPS
jgi:nucleoid-associated protein YgaU